MKSNSMLVVYLFFLLLDSTRAFSSENCSHAGKEPIRCSSIENLKSLRPGSTCISKTGFIFERALNGWKDPQGIVWSDEFKANTDLSESTIFCNKKNLRLPALEEIRLADMQGLLELVPKLQKRRLWYWTTDFVRREYSIIYSLDSSMEDLSPPNFKFETYGVRCVRGKN